MPSAGGLNPIQHALKDRADRLRQELIDSGVLSVTDVAELRRSSVEDARALLERESERYRLFTVVVDSEPVVPHILLTSDGEPTKLSIAVEVLSPYGVTGWELWAWLAFPTDWLSGDIPADIFSTDPKRALAAVSAYAETLWHRRPQHSEK